MGLLDIFQKKNKGDRLLQKIDDQRKAECPYCNNALKKIPAKKTKCPHCGKYIFVRTKPNKMRATVTKEQAAAIDNDWLVRQSTDDKDLNGEKEFYVEKKILQARFGKEPSISDIKWGLLNKRANEAMKKSDFSALSGIYSQMALQKHEEGKDHREEQKQVQKMQLLELRNNEVVTQVEIFSSDDGCEDCKRLNGKVFSITDALKEMPLPVLTCKNETNRKAPHGWCRCIYLPVISKH